MEYEVEKNGRKRRLYPGECVVCGKSFMRPSQGKGTRKCCSTKCANSITGNSNIKPLEIICSECGKIFKRVPSKVGKGKHGENFCGLKCKNKAQSLKGKCRTITPSHYGTSKHYSQKSTTVCPKCTGSKHRKSTICKNCRDYEIHSHKLELPIKDLFNTDGATRSKYNNIRHWARKTMHESDKKKECTVCGFNVYVEVSHIKPISSFDIETPLKEVNNLDNLCYLCPNHHRMLDKGYLCLIL